VRLLRSRRGVVGLCLLALLALFLIRPGANRLRARIVQSVSTAIGRPVQVGSVNLRFIPRPGFELQDFIVQEDAAFGAEPLLRAQEVTASLRVMPLLRGRIEIASLSLTEPSLNLARNGAGHWNLENLVERTEKIPVAPTNKARSETRPGFPYIEGQRGRINFKLGDEKTSYALTSADFAIWQDSENVWGMRLRAQPMRTDMNLTDTGLIRMNGSFQRAISLHDTPLQFTLQWDRPQMGQLTKLFYGTDKGWRGTALISVSLSGTPGNLVVESTASVSDFRRYDVIGGGNLDLAAQCTGHYSSFENELDNVSCTAPVRDGNVSVTGRVRHPLISPDYELAVTVQDVPTQSVVALIRHAKLGLPDDLAATGEVSAHATMQRDHEAKTPFHWQGGGEARGIRISSAITETDLDLSDVSFALFDPNQHTPRARWALSRTASPGVTNQEARLGLGRFRVALGGSTPVSVSGWLSRRGYNFSINGEVDLQRALQAARTAGLPALQTSAEGSASVDLETAGAWKGFAPAQINGKAQLLSVRAPLRGLSEPLEISAANLVLSTDQVKVRDLSAKLAGTTWRGSLVRPRPCPAGCTLTFDLHADEISWRRLTELLNLPARSQPWYQFLLSSASSANYLLSLNAAGRISSDKIVLGKISGTHFLTNIELNVGRVELSGLHAELLGGRHSGEWKANFTTKPPQYSGSGKIERVTLAGVSSAMHDNWITGIADATYEVSASGSTAAECIASASGTADFDLRDGSLPLLAVGAGNTAPQVRRLAMRLNARNGKLEIEDGKVDTSTATYQLRGLFSYEKGLDLKLSRKDASGFGITGALASPHVSPIIVPATQAQLKQ